MLTKEKELEHLAKMIHAKRVLYYYYINQDKVAAAEILQGEIERAKKKIERIENGGSI